MPANARSHAVLTTESKVTIRGQTTIPAPVREALKLKPGQARTAFITKFCLVGKSLCADWEMNRRIIL